MVKYYQFDVISNDGNRLIYPIDLNLISGLKYEWEPDNTGIGGGVKHATCVCKSDDDLPKNITTITQTEYDDFDKIIFVTDKSQINANNSDIASLTVTMPKAKGTFVCKCRLPDGTIENVESINVNEKTLSHFENVKTSLKGQIKVTLYSNVWYTPQTERPEVLINAT